MSESRIGATKMRVLVVEDDRVSAAFLRDTLTFFGYQVTTAVDGQEAFELLRSGEFRMVVTDWEMPQMNGDELCRQVRRRQWNSYIYIVLVTSFNEIDHVVEGLRAAPTISLPSPIILKNFA